MMRCRRSMFSSVSGHDTQRQSPVASLWIGQAIPKSSLRVFLHHTSRAKLAVNFTRKLVEGPDGT